jgi:hypothetical protein
MVTEQSPEELETLAINAWRNGNITEARHLHAEARKSGIPWIIENDYWYYAPDVRVNKKSLKTPANTSYLNAKISVLIIGYARPEGAMRCATSAKISADRPELLEILVATDTSDTLKDRYLALPEINAYVIDKHTSSDKWNFLYEKCSGDIIVMVADDVIFESRGWDEALRRSWPEDGIAVMFSDSTPNNGNELLEFPIVSRKMTEALNYAAYPELAHGGLDTWWQIIGKELGRLYYLGEVWRLRHHHYETSIVHNRGTREGVNIIRDYMQLIENDTETLRKLL